MSKIKEYLEGLADLTMLRTKQVKIDKATNEPDQIDLLDLEGSARVLAIITSALVELGVSDGVKSKINQAYLDLPFCNWDGTPTNEKAKIREEAILSYNEQTNQNNENKEITLVEISCITRSYYINLTINEFEELVYGEKR